MFNHVVVSDEEFASRLPETEFELSFNREGDIYVDGEPLGVNVKQRYQSLAMWWGRFEAYVGAQWLDPL